jgi:cytochrome P450
MTKNASRQEFLAAREPKGPPPISFLTLLRGKLQVDPLQRWGGIRTQFGDVARYRLGPADTFLVQSAEGARRILQENASNYTKAHLSYATLRRLLGNGLLTSDGSFWLRQRRLAQPAFHKQRIAAMAGQMVAAAERRAAAWTRLSPGEPVAMLREMTTLTLEVVAAALFGTALPERAAEIEAAWNVLSAQLAERALKRRVLPPILPTAYDRAFRRARATFFAVVDEVIAKKRREGTAGDDLLSMLMEARDEDTGETMDDRQLRDEVVTMLLGGHETTATALAWTWARLHLHPEVEEKLHAELREVLGGRAPTAADFPRLTYTRALFEEVLRLHPPVFLVNRTVAEDDVVDGYRVYRRGSIVLSPLMIHRNPAYWPEPEVFRPERFLNPEAENERPRFAFIPFSGGPRQCIGNGFAMMEAVLVIATLAQRFRPRLVDGRLPEMEYRVLARPRGPVLMTTERAFHPIAGVSR